MCSKHTRDQETSFGGSSQYKVHDASGRNKDVLRLKRDILVAKNEEKDNRICVTMPTIPTSQGRTSKTGGTTTTPTNTGMEIGVQHYGFRRWTIELAMRL